MIKTIYEDNHLLVVEKPINVPVQEDSSGDIDFLTMLKEDIKERFQKPGNVYLGLVHRLDRPVGGVMVFAKTSKAASRLSDQIRKNEFKKTYLAVVHEMPIKKQDTLVHYLLKDEKTNTSKVVDKNTRGAKEAILDYEVIGQSEKFSLVKINLHTGRSHQIRVQFAAIGHTLYGDQKYGEKVNKPGQQIALWAWKLGLVHPVTKEEMTFESSPPETFPWEIFELSVVSGQLSVKSIKN